MLGPCSIIYHSSEQCEEVAQIGDQTIQVLQLEQPLTKTAVEMAQATHFQRQVAAIPEWAFTIEHARDRPDFWIQRNGRRLGLDVAALASTSRRRAADQFRKIKLVLMAAHRRGRLRQCRGIEVQLFFSTERIPTPQHFDKSAEELIFALEKYSVDAEAWEQIDRNQFLQGLNPYPMGQHGESTDKSMNWHVSGLTNNQTIFSSNCGFNIEHQYTEIASATTFFAQVQRIISSHDVSSQNIDELLLVAGGPDIFGEAIAGESTIAEMYFEKWQGTIKPPAHLSRIYLDNWLLGKPRLIFDRGLNYTINQKHC